MSGAIAGRARSAGKSVFRSSLPPKRAGKPSERAATGELWSGFGRPERSAGASFAERSAPSAGMGAGAFAAIALLGLGLAGICASLGAIALRRRRAPAGARSTGRGSNEA